MTTNFKITDTDSFCIWFEYLYRGKVYHGFYDCVNLVIDEPHSKALEEKLEDLCDEYIYGGEYDV